jgi:hypothetical protein
MHTVTAVSEAVTVASTIDIASMSSFLIGPWLIVIFSADVWALVSLRESRT